MDRRKFIQLGAGTATLAGGALAFPLAAQAALSPLHNSDETVSFYKVIVDEYSLEAQAFGREMSALGNDIYSAGNDVTDLWSKVLVPQWAKESKAIAGLTTMSTFVILEQMARDAWMAVAYKGIHDVNESGAFVHSLHGPDSMVKQASTLLESRTWTNSVAQAISATPMSPLKQAKASNNIVTTGTLSNQLVSWVISPISGTRAAV